MARDVRTNRAARRAACDQRAGAGRALRLRCGLRPRRLAPRNGRAGRRCPFHGAHHVQGHGRVPDDALDQRGRRRGRRVVQRRDRSRVDRVLGPRARARGGPRRRRPRGAHRPADARQRRDRGRAIGDHRGDPLVPRRSERVLPDPVPGRALRGGTARARDLRGRGGDPGAARHDHPRLLAGHVPARQHGRRDRRRSRSRRGGRAGRDRLRVRQRRHARVRGRPRAARRPPGDARQARHDPGPAVHRACRRSAATIRTAGPSRCSTRSSATG